MRTPAERRWSSRWSPDRGAEGAGEEKAADGAVEHVHLLQIAAEAEGGVRTVRDGDAHWEPLSDAITGGGGGFTGLVSGAGFECGLDEGFMGAWAGCDFLCSFAASPDCLNNEDGLAVNFRKLL